MFQLPELKRYKESHTPLGWHTLSWSNVYLPVFIVYIKTCSTTQIDTRYLSNNNTSCPLLQYCLSALSVTLLFWNTILYCPLQFRVYKISCSVISKCIPSGQFSLLTTGIRDRERQTLNTHDFFHRNCVVTLYKAYDTYFNTFITVLTILNNII